MTSSSGQSTPARPPCPPEVPPPAKSLKASVVPSLRPDPQSPNPAWACGGAERSGVAADGAPGRGGAALAAAPSPRRPVPEDDSPPPARPLPTLASPRLASPRRGAASRLPPPARRPPPPPAALPPWPRAAQAAERGSALGWDLEEAAREETAAAARVLPALARAAPGQDRVSREADDRAPGRRARAGGCSFTFFLFLKMEKMLVGCFLLVLGQILLVLPAEAKERTPWRSISRGRHAWTHPQTALLVVHMCSVLEHNCAHFCINTPGSYVCRCKQGYILNSDQTTCRIQDLCAAKAHGCEQLCVNVLGSFVCQCYSGFTLAEDGKTCAAVDYCASENHGCEHECVNADSSYFCRCRKGFTLNPDKKTCAKIDYCASPNQGCQHECVNTDDSYSCRCLKGFTLNPDKKTCRRINYCALNKPGCEHECINIEDGYYCRCRQGYTLDPNGKTCSRVDHCAEQDHGCEQLCLNTEDSYVCQCSEGFLINDDLKTCSRADYCLLSNHGCEYSCVNTDRSFVCRCPEGYVLRSDGKTCAKLDSCAVGDHDCEHSCVSSGDSFVCQCFEGYILREDGKTCRRKGVCQSVNHGCEHICVNSDESYICKCREGFRLAEDGKRCRRKDVCKSTYHGCEHICVNHGNSYICKCSEGFVLAEDGKRCKRCTEGPLDLVFVIDGSKSLGEENFEIVKQFVAGIIDSLAVSPKAARVGLLQYSTQVRTEFTLGDFSSARDMKKAVAHMKYMGKGSMTGLALKHMFERSFNPVEGARPVSPGVSRVAIVFTDGRAQDDVSAWARRARAGGITMYAVGVGKAIEEELQEIASEPTDKHLFYAEDFSTMGEISEKLKKGICEALEDSDGSQDSPAGELPKRVHQPTESEPVTINIRDLLSCSNFAVQHRYLFEEDSVSRSTQKLFHSTKSSGSPLEEKHDQCKCENLIMFQNLANEEVRKLTQRYILF
uniref:Matrilin-2 n=1 Tax=Canis lupus familiaris TaxID=9615 RepID=A0A8C0NSV1_CANLF